MDDDEWSERGSSRRRSIRIIGVVLVALLAIPLIVEGVRVVVEAFG
jgi:hypothetical protein